MKNFSLALEQNDFVPVAHGQVDLEILAVGAVRRLLPDTACVCPACDRDGLLDGVGDNFFRGGSLRRNFARRGPLRRIPDEPENDLAAGGRGQRGRQDHHPSVAGLEKDIWIMVARMFAEWIEILGVDAVPGRAAMNPKEWVVETGVQSRHEGEAVFTLMRQEAGEFIEQLVDLAAKIVLTGRPSDLCKGFPKRRQHRRRNLRQREEFPPC